MKITIYDYANMPSTIEVPDDKKITEIQVMVLTGDETGTILFDDGSTIDFDASDCRITDYYDGDYSVTGEQIMEWINYAPSGNRTVSYERRGVFDVEEVEE